MKWADCPEMVGSRVDTPGCGKCGSPLPKRRVHWCSDDCANWWHSNHWFNTARRYALIRAEVWSLAAVEIVAGEWSWPRKPGLGDRYEGPFFHEHQPRGIGYACEMCGSVTRQVEVDHIEAANGAHSVASCLHHQENLRVLCVPCLQF